MSRHQLQEHALDASHEGPTAISISEVRSGSLLQSSALTPFSVLWIMNERSRPAPTGHLMNRLFRPGTVVFISGALVLVAGVLLFWPFDELARGTHPILRPVPAGDEEIVWLNPATNSVGWERLVAAVHHLRTARPDLGVEFASENKSFPSQTTQVPEFAIDGAGAEIALVVSLVQAHRQPRPQGMGTGFDPRPATASRHCGRRQQRPGQGLGKGPGRRDA